MTDMDKEAYEERAAIMEFCAGMSRSEAERLARLGPVRKTEPPPLPRADKQTPGYLAFRETWHQKHPTKRRAT